MKIPQCKHCGAIASHFSFQCAKIKKPIKPKVGDTFIPPNDKDWQGFPKQFKITKITPSKPKSEKTLKELKELAQIVVNRYVRKLYSKSDNTTRCYTCLRWVSTKQIDASHFISVRHQSTRFDLNNLRSCCQDCNRYAYGNLKRFRQHLVAEIGEDAVEELEMRSKQHKHWTREELQELITKYK